METRDDELVNLKVFTNSENLRWSFNPSTIFLRNTITETPAKKKKKPYCNPTFISSTNTHFLYKDTIPLKRSAFVVVHQTPQYAHTAMQGLSCVSCITCSHFYGKSRGKSPISTWHTHVSPRTNFHFCFWQVTHGLDPLSAQRVLNLVRLKWTGISSIALPHTWDSLMAWQLIYA